MALALHPYLPELYAPVGGFILEHHAWSWFTCLHEEKSGVCHAGQGLWTHGSDLGTFVGIVAPLILVHPVVEADLALLVGLWRQRGVWPST